MKIIIKTMKASYNKMLFSVVIPAHNEESVIENTLQNLVQKLQSAKINYEIVVVADHCTDKTITIIDKLSKEFTQIRYVENPEQPGFGMAVRAGLNSFKGDAVAIYMADASDSPDDLIKYFNLIEEGADCVFGSRFISGGKTYDYPTHKLILNRFTNWFIRLCFQHGYNDTTNAFKCYRRKVIETCSPLLAKHFNLTVELPLKAVIRGYSFKVVPISWTNRTAGVSKLKIKEMGSRYFFIIFYCLLERWLTGNDYTINSEK